MERQLLLHDASRSVEGELEEAPTGRKRESPRVQPSVSREHLHRHFAGEVEDVLPEEEGEPVE